MRADKQFDKMRTARRALAGYTCAAEQSALSYTGEGLVQPTKWPGLCDEIPIELEIFKNIYHSIAEEMGAALRRTAFSPNIKERRDYSCAIFDADGEVIAMGDHMPVHLGSMPMSVRAAIESLRSGPATWSC